MNPTSNLEFELENGNLGCRELCRIKKQEEEDELENKIGEGVCPSLVEFEKEREREFLGLLS